MLPKTDRSVMPVEPLIDPVSLIQRIAAQNRDAFSQFYDRYSPIVHYLALRMLREQSDAPRNFSSSVAPSHGL